MVHMTIEVLNMTSPLHYLEPYSLSVLSDAEFLYCMDNAKYIIMSRITYSQHDMKLYVSLGTTFGMFTCCDQLATKSHYKHLHSSLDPSMVSFYKYKHELKKMLPTSFYNSVIRGGSYDNRNKSY